MVILRKALPSDTDFIVEAIIESEKSGTDKFSYCTLFGLATEEVSEIIKEILTEDIQGQKFCLEQFIIATVNDEPAGACSSWIEGGTGSSSSYLQGQILLAFFPRENVADARDRLEMAKDLTIEREYNALQIESVYVKPNFRGLGIAGKIIVEHIQNALKGNPDLKKTQIVVAKTNDSAVKSYTKLGFEVVEERHCGNKDILNFLPADTLVVMENIKPLNDYKSNSFLQRKDF
jgi:ribosomal protein S18 acetylase RimI-like enzyme